jgi:hypothetical protein
MEQRWPDIAPFFSVPGGSDHFAHPGHHHHHHHHHHHPNYTSLGPGTGHHGHYEASATVAQRNVLLHNATLAPPVGDLNSTGSYHNTGEYISASLLFRKLGPPRPTNSKAHSPTAQRRLHAKPRPAWPIRPAKPT